MCKIIRIYYECEGGIEKSILRIKDWHHGACRVMTNTDLEWRTFLSHPHTNNGFFFCSPLNTSFYIGKTKKTSRKSWIHWDTTWWHHFNITMTSQKQRKSRSGVREKNFYPRLKEWHFLSPNLLCKNHSYWALHRSAKYLEFHYWWILPSIDFWKVGYIC